MATEYGQQLQTDRDGNITVLAPPLPPIDITHTPPTFPPPDDEQAGVDA